MRKSCAIFFMKSLESFSISMSVRKRSAIYHCGPLLERFLGRVLNPAVKPSISSARPKQPRLKPLNPRLLLTTTQLLRIVCTDTTGKYLTETLRKAMETAITSISRCTNIPTGTLVHWLIAMLGWTMNSPIYISSCGRFFSVQ